MNHPTNKGPLHNLAVVAIFCCFASVGIVALAFCLLRNISGAGMWAIAAMSAAPPMMGIAIAYIMIRHPRLDVPSIE